MHDNYYATVAQIIPVLLLALMWDSAYLDRLRGQTRSPRSKQADQPGYFWTKKRVRAFILTLTKIALAALLLDILTLAGAVPDTTTVRATVFVGLALMSVVLLFRIWVDVINATDE